MPCIEMGLPGTMPGKPPSSWVDSRELRPQLGLFGEMSKELGESRRQQDGVAAQLQVGVLVAELEVLRRQMADAFGGRAGQQGDRAGSPDVRR